MKTFLFCVTFTLAAACLMHWDFAEAQAKEKSCKAVIGDLTKMQLKVITECTKTMKFKNTKDKSSKMNCIMKCGLEKVDLVSKAGEINQEQINILLNREIPPSLIERANTTFQPCVQKFQGTLDANPETDPLCATYDPVIKCVLSALPQFCPPPAPKP